MAVAQVELDAPLYGLPESDPIRIALPRVSGGLPPGMQDVCAWYDERAEDWSSEGCTPTSASGSEALHGPPGHAALRQHPRGPRARDGPKLKEQPKHKYLLITARGDASVGENW